MSTEIRRENTGYTLDRYPTRIVGSSEVSEDYARVYRNPIRSHSMVDEIAALRDNFLFDDFKGVEEFVRRQPGLVGALMESLPFVQRIFGAGISLWIRRESDWEGTESLCLLIEFSGTGEAASRLCRQLTREWLVGLPTELQPLLSLDARFE